jgi:hypothetical protein
MNVGDPVRFINNQNELDPDECEVVESCGDYYRLRKPTGQIIRIYKDRVQPINRQEEPTVTENDESVSWDDIPGEVWIKSNRFNETTVCETVAIIDPEADHYKSINTYNSKAQKVMVYPMKNYNALVKRMAKKGYKKKKSS